MFIYFTNSCVCLEPVVWVGRVCEVLDVHRVVGRLLRRRLVGAERVHQRRVLGAAVAKLNSGQRATEGNTFSKFQTFLNFNFYLFQYQSFLITVGDRMRSLILLSICCSDQFSENHLAIRNECVRNVCLMLSISYCYQINLSHSNSIKWRLHTLRRGGVAQMVERSLSMQEVRGSIPCTSKTFALYSNLKFTDAGLFCCAKLTISSSFF